MERTIGDASWLYGETLTYADLSLFQTVEGLHFAFPRAMPALARSHPKVTTLVSRVRQLPALRDYLTRRIPFGNGLFRHYPELDGEE